MRLSADGIDLQVLAPSLNPHVDQAGLVELTKLAVARWQRGLGDHLPSVRVRPAEPGAKLGLAEDGVSVLRLQLGSWCPDSAEDARDCYDPSRRAITHIYQDRATPGVAIDEADVEVSLPGLEDDGAAAQLKDRLFATLLHELGHVYGLGHVCGSVGESACEADHATGSVMYPYATQPGRELVLEPSDADRAALTDIYLPPSQAGVIQVLGAWGLAALLFVVMWRRRAGRSAARGGGDA